MVGGSLCPIRFIQVSLQFSFNDGAVTVYGMTTTTVRGQLHLNESRVVKVSNCGRLEGHKRLMRELGGSLRGRVSGREEE